MRPRYPTTQWTNYKTQVWFPVHADPHSLLRSDGEPVLCMAPTNFSLRNLAQHRITVIIDN